ncbi:MAG: hypothetical protein JWM76_853 [Pseudonocardiales bacterium]|nr:hypothetical protein [Pseudonocardiales bacterium]
MVVVVTVGVLVVVVSFELLPLEAVLVESVVVVVVEVVVEVVVVVAALCAECCTP